MKILICDDEPDVVRVAKVTLEHRGHEVVTAWRASEAIEIFEQWRKDGKSFDLIVTDVLMPGDSGFYLAGHVRAKGYTGRLAVMTGMEINEAETSNLARVDAEYWDKTDSIAHLIDRVEGGADCADAAE